MMKFWKGRKDNSSEDVNQPVNGKPYYESKDEKKDYYDQDRDQETSDCGGGGCRCCRSCGALTAERIKMALMFAAVILGVALGVAFQSVPAFQGKYWGPRILMYVRLPSDFIFNLVSILSVPITITSLVSKFSHLRFIMIQNS